MEACGGITVHDQVCECDFDVVLNFLEDIAVAADTRILDIGCGTGSYTGLVRNMTWASVVGIDPCGEVLAEARRRNPQTHFEQARASDLPFAGDSFDYAFMFDVVHLVPDLVRSLAEIRRVLRPRGGLCIATQSHRQIRMRVTSEFFPATVEIDLARYPDIDRLIEMGRETGLDCTRQRTIAQQQDVIIGAEYFDQILTKSYSVLQLIADEEYRQGLSRLKQALAYGPIRRKTTGSTQLWFVRRG